MCAGQTTYHITELDLFCLSLFVISMRFNHTHTELSGELNTVFLFYSLPRCLPLNEPPSFPFLFPFFFHALLLFPISPRAQLTGRKLPLPTSASEEEVFAVLGDACACMNVLLVLDDVWELKHAQALHFLDRGTASKLLITTRLKGVFPRASEFELGLIDRDDAAALMLDCGGESHGAPPYSDHV